MKKMTDQQRKRARYAVVIIALLLVVITFTPLILRPGKTEPGFLSLPYTLWTSMLITIVLVILTYLASKVQDKD